jgi:hypothetical protein
MIACIAANFRINGPSESGLHGQQGTQLNLWTQDGLAPMRTVLKQSCSVRSTMVARFISWIQIPIPWQSHKRHTRRICTHAIEQGEIVAKQGSGALYIGVFGLLEVLMDEQKVTPVPGRNNCVVSGNRGDRQVGARLCLLGGIVHEEIP